jgi:hypothetical protein
LRGLPTLIFWAANEQAPLRQNAQFAAAFNFALLMQTYR